MIAPPLDNAHVEMAKASLDKIEYFETVEGLLVRASQLTGNTCIIVDLRTSRKATISKFVEVAAQVCAQQRAGRSVKVAVVVDDRYDIFGDAKEKMQAVFRQHTVSLVQLTRGELQYANQKPVYAFVAHQPLTKLQGMPSSVKFGTAVECNHTRHRLVFPISPPPTPPPSPSLGVVWWLFVFV